MKHLRSAFIWLGFVAVIAVPVAFAATSPLLAWRQPIYIIAGLAGVLGLAVLLTQPLLIAGSLPGLAAPKGRRVHRWLGAALVGLIFVHIAGLWITSPPDMIDALTFTSPTPFAPWGVVAMWAIFGAAGLAAYRRRLRLPVWRVGHSALVSIAVVGSVVHAMMIEGTMEVISKATLGGLAVLASAWILIRLRSWAAMRRPYR